MQWVAVDGWVVGMTVAVVLLLADFRKPISLLIFHFRMFEMAVTKA
jgi:hypothetical protein